MRRLAFARKQRAIRDAVLIGDRIIRRKRRELMSAVLNAWRMHAGLYRQVAQRFRSAMEVSMRTCLSMWRATVREQVRKNSPPVRASETS